MQRYYAVSVVLSHNLLKWFPYYFVSRLELVRLSLLEIGRVITFCRIGAVFNVAILSLFGGVRLALFHKLLGLLQSESTRLPDNRAETYAEDEGAYLIRHMGQCIFIHNSC